MANGYLKSILTTISLLFLITATLIAGCIGDEKSSDVIVIQPPNYCEQPEQNCHESGYTWERSHYQLGTLHINSPGEYTFANANFPDKFDIKVGVSRDQDEEIVTIDGTGVIINQIYGGAPNLKNIHIESDYTIGISSCNDIVDSSILVLGLGEGTGINSLYGNMEKTKITVESLVKSNGINFLFGTISSGEITVTAAQTAIGVNRVEKEATISGGTFTITGLSSFTHGIFMHEPGSIISGGEFIVNGEKVEY
jgi:hypothetical protein